MSLPLLPTDSEKFLAPAMCKYKTTVSTKDDVPHLVVQDSAYKERMSSALGLDVHYELNVPTNEGELGEVRLQPFNPRISGPSCPYPYTGRIPEEKDIRAVFDDPIQVGKLIEGTTPYDSQLYAIRDPRLTTKTIVIRDFGCKVPVDPVDNEKLAQAVLNFYPQQYVQFLNEFVSNLFGEAMRNFLGLQIEGYKKMLEDPAELNRISWGSYVAVKGEFGAAGARSKQDPSLKLDETTLTAMNQLANNGTGMTSNVNAFDFYDVRPCIRQHIKTLTMMKDDFCKGYSTTEIAALVMMYYANEQGHTLAWNRRLVKDSDVPNYDGITIMVPYDQGELVTIPENANPDRLSGMYKNLKAEERQAFVFKSQIHRVGSWSGTSTNVFLTSTSAPFRWDWGRDYRELKSVRLQNQAVRGANSAFYPYYLSLTQAIENPNNPGQFLQQAATLDPSKNRGKIYTKPQLAAGGQIVSLNLDDVITASTAADCDDNLRNLLLQRGDHPEETLFRGENRPYRAVVPTTYATPNAPPAYRPKAMECIEPSGNKDCVLKYSFGSDPFLQDGPVFSRSAEGKLQMNMTRLRPVRSSDLKSEHLYHSVLRYVASQAGSTAPAFKIDDSPVWLLTSYDARHKLLYLNVNTKYRVNAFTSNFDVSKDTTVHCNMDNLMDVSDVDELGFKIYTLRKMIQYKFGPFVAYFIFHNAYSDAIHLPGFKKYPMTAVANSPYVHFDLKKIYEQTMRTVKARMYYYMTAGPGFGDWQLCMFRQLGRRRSNRNLLRDQINTYNWLKHVSNSANPEAVYTFLMQFAMETDEFLPYFGSVEEYKNKCYPSTTGIVDAWSNLYPNDPDKKEMKMLFDEFFKERAFDEEHKYRAREETSEAEEETSEAEEVRKAVEQYKLARASSSDSAETENREDLEPADIEHKLDKLDKIEYVDSELELIYDIFYDKDGQRIKFYGDDTMIEELHNALKELYEKLSKNEVERREDNRLIMKFLIGEYLRKGVEANAVALLLALTPQEINDKRYTEPTEPINDFIEKQKEAYTEFAKTIVPEATPARPEAFATPARPQVDAFDGFTEPRALQFAERADLPDPRALQFAQQAGERSAINQRVSSIMEPPPRLSQSNAAPQTPAPRASGAPAPRASGASRVPWSYLPNINIGRSGQRRPSEALAAVPGSPIRDEFSRMRGSETSRGTTPYGSIRDVDNETPFNAMDFKHDLRDVSDRPSLFTILQIASFAWHHRTHSSVADSHREEPRNEDEFEDMHPWCSTLVETFAFAQKKETFDLNALNARNWTGSGDFPTYSDVTKEPNKYLPTSMIGQMSDDTYKLLFPLVPSCHKLRDHLRRVRALNMIWGEIVPIKPSHQAGAWMPFSEAHRCKILQSVGLFDIKHSVPSNPWLPRNTEGLCRVYNQSYHSVFPMEGPRSQYYKKWIEDACKYQKPHFSVQNRLYPFSQYGGTPVEADFLYHVVERADPKSSEYVKERHAQIVYNRFGFTKAMRIGQQFEDTALLQDMYSFEFRPHVKLSKDQREHISSMKDEDMRVGISSFMAYARNHAIIALSSCNHGTNMISEPRVVRNLYRMFVDAYQVCTKHPKDGDDVPIVMGFLPATIAKRNDRPVVMFAGALPCLNAKIERFCYSNANRGERVCQNYKQTYLNDAALLFTRLVKSQMRKDLHENNFHRVRKVRRGSGKDYDKETFYKELVDNQDAYIEFLQTTLLSMSLESDVDMRNLPLHLLEPRSIEVTEHMEDTDVVGNDFLGPRTLEIVRDLNLDDGSLSKTQLAIMSLMPPNHRILGTMRLDQKTEVLDLEHVRKMIQKQTIEGNKKVWNDHMQKVIRASLGMRYLEENGQTIDFSLDETAFKDPLKESAALERYMTTKNTHQQGSVLQNQMAYNLRKDKGPTSLHQMNKREWEDALQVVRARVEKDYQVSRGARSRLQCLLEIPKLPQHVVDALRSEFDQSVTY